MDGDRVDQNLDETFNDTTHVSNQTDEAYEPLSGKYKYGVERTINYSSLNIENKRLVSNLNKTIEPKNYEEASLDPNLIKTMNDETEALYYNYTRTITILPKNYKPIGCKWVCKIKYKPSGEVERYNARLVAKGYNLREGLDINNAFLYDGLSKDAFMIFPQGYPTQGDIRVCKLVKSLYGLKQAPKKWNEIVFNSLFSFGFQRRVNYYSIFVRNKNNYVIVLLVYVDDIILTCSDCGELEKVENIPKSLFLIKDLGKLSYFLGIEFLNITNGCKPIKTPLEAKKFATRDNDKNDEKLENITKFQRLVGKLIYLTITRPDISYRVQILNLSSLIKIAFRLLRYIGKGSVACKIVWVLKVLFDLGIKNLTSFRLSLYFESSYRIFVVRFLYNIPKFQEYNPKITKLRKNMDVYTAIKSGPSLSNRKYLKP
uniref:Reverse transcriptase Ty1/copia-type domain-containing protein n=1 Tax=Lactuca sativa TaxID=4236 RepID=A0A9R1UKM4_LACSA|nr:hypothetical protein LSAT_V11C900492590 [Lactuca sativa]